MPLAAFADVVLPHLAMASAQSLLLVAGIWLLCRYSPRLPAAARCLLWWMAALQLVIGLLWHAPLELPVLPSASASIAMDAGGESAASAHRVTMSPEAALARRLSRTSQTAEIVRTASPSRWPVALTWLWLCGVMAMALRSARGYRQAMRRRRTSYPCERADILHRYRRLGMAMGLQRIPLLRVSDAIDSPQLLGPWRPLLLLPGTALTCFSAGELEMALRHELAHVRRRDLWWGWIPALAQHLFFFHPLAHVIAREYAFAREAACDASVLSCRRHSPHDYGRLLLRLGVFPRPCAGMSSASPTFTLLKRRLVMLQNAATPPRLTVLALSLGLVLVGVLPYRVIASGASVTSPASGQVAIIRNGDFAFVLMQGDDFTASGEQRDLEDARRARGKGEALLWFRKQDSRYLVRDPALLERIQHIWAPVNKLGEQQGQLGDQQGKLGERQATLGQQQGDLGARMGQLSEQQAVIAMKEASIAMAEGPGAERQRTELEKQQSALDAKQQELGRQQEDLGRQQLALGTQQSLLGEKQSALGERQSAASDHAHRQTQRLIDDAIAKGLAQPIRR